LAFATAMVALLAAAGAFVYVRLRADLDDAIAATLRSRWQAAATLYGDGGSLAGFPLEDPEESFVQVLDADGTVLAQAGGVAGPALEPDQTGRAARSTLTVQRHLAGIDGRAQIRAESITLGGPIVLVGQSLVDRDEALADLRGSFLLGGPAAVALASVFGFWLARRAFAPVEAIRSTADRLSLVGGDQRLPVPDTSDEIHRLAVTLNLMIDRLAQAFERERRFVADASHELRTPIAVMKVELEAALLNRDRPHELTESLRAALDECDGLAQLAEDMLVLARTTDNGLVLSIERLPATDLLDEIAQRFGDRAARHERRCVVRVEGNPVMAGDRLALRQALSNLVDNALRHGSGDIVLRAVCAGGVVELDVTDHGPGFDTELMHRAFERFSRGVAARTGDGAGLGLAIVDAIARAHGGTVSIVGNGPTTVRLSIPVADDRRSAALPSTGSSGAQPV
jgi:signal transduction histidine kinase